jgi:salicylate hydroxylase
LRNESTTPLSCLIVGAGLGGLAATIALRQAGHAVTVLEQAPALGAIGAGIQTAPNASRLLAEWGVAEVLGRTAVESECSNRRRWQDGRLLGSFPQGDALRKNAGAPYWLAHRADLHAALLEVATADHDRGEPATLELDQRVEGIESGDEGAAVITGGGKRFEADLVIGADGINSVVRSRLFGPRSTPFAGQVTRRMIVPVDAVADLPGFDELLVEPSLTIWIGPDRHCVLHPVHGRTHLYLGITAETPEWNAEWSETKDQLATAIADWDPRIGQMVDAAPEMTAWPLYDDAPLDRWVEGRIALIGDACHPMLPFQAQGAAQAMEDGAALATALANTTTVESGLRSYQDSRLPRATRVQAASRENGPAFHLPDGPAQAARDAKLAVGGGDFDSYLWLWSARPDGSRIDAIKV